MLKRYCSIAISILLLQTGVWANAFADEAAVWKEFYVSPFGELTGDGSMQSPFGSLEQAQNAVREINEQMQGDIIIHVQEGEYYLDRQLNFTPEDSGKNGYRVIWRGENEPLLSAGQKLDPFLPSEEYPGLWETKLEGQEYVRNLYVNDQARHMAKSAAMVTGVKKPEKYDTIAYYEANPNAPKDSYTFYDPNTPYQYDGLYMSKEDIGFYENPEDIEFCWNIEWETDFFKVQSITSNPDDDTQVIVRMEQSIWDWVCKRNLNGIAPNGKRPFYIRNAFELLDSPGEFYYNRTTQTLYYMPYADENMETAECVIPKIDKILVLDGDSPSDKVENITFEGFRFAHSMWTSAGEGSMNISQGSFTHSANEGGNMIGGSVYLNMARNISFQENVFYGMGAGAIEMINGVEDSQIIGNVFEDIGAAAVAIGTPAHSDKILETISTPPQEQMLCNVANPVDSNFSVSYYGTGNNTMENYWGGDGGPRIETDYRRINYVTGYNNIWYTWKGDPSAPEKNEKSWIRYDFKRPYKIEKIVTAFNQENTRAEERQLYEILLSNDRYFREGQYVRVAVQQEPAGLTEEYLVAEPEEYRYLMVRTVGATPFAISNVYAFTSDKPAYKLLERCKNIEIQNNCINRAGGASPNAGGILMFYVEQMKVLHNEITDLPYSGIQLGWGWSNALTGSSDNLIQYNYISNCNRLIGDGGAVYSLSRNDGTIVSNNYFDHLNKANAGVYPDEGSAGMVWHDNVVANSGKAMHLHVPTIIDNTIYNTYSSTSEYLNNAPQNQVDAPILYTQGQEPEAVWVIRQEAGLEDGYTHLREKITEQNDGLMPEYTLGHRALTEVAENILNSNNFGIGYGTYPYEYRTELSNALEQYKDESSSANLVTLNKTVCQSTQKLNRLSLEEMLAVCEQKEDAENYTAAAWGQFQNAVQDCAAKNLQTMTTQQKYWELVGLEQAYTLLEQGKIWNGLDFVEADGSKDVILDAAQHTVKILYDKFADTTKAYSVTFATHGTAQIADVWNTIFIGETKNLPIYCTHTQEYVYWTISAEREQETTQPVLLTHDDFVTESREQEAIVPLANGQSALLYAGPYVYTALKSAGGNAETSVRFLPVNRNAIGTITLVIGDKKASHYEVRFDKEKTELYFLQDGQERLLCTSQRTILFDDENTVQYTGTNIGSNTNLKMVLNGGLLFDEIGPAASGNYLGIFSPKMHVQLYDALPEHPLAEILEDGL